MDWWYKNKKKAVNPDSIVMMQDAIKTILRDGNSLASIKLYHDPKHFYIKTTNKIVLSHFLFQNGFEEMDDEQTENDLNLIYAKG